MNVPNKISMCRIILSIILLVIMVVPLDGFGIDFPEIRINSKLLVDSKDILCGLMFVIASLTDFLDGQLARKYNIVTDLGKVLDAITPTENSKYNFVFSSNHGETDFRLIADGCFVCWGNKPATDFLRESGVELDDNGFIVHADGIHRPFTETTEPGIYVCGDCMQGAYHQLSIAAGNGATCALDVIKYLEGK